MQDLANERAVHLIHSIRKRDLHDQLLSAVLAGVVSHEVATESNVLSHHTALA